MLRVVVTTRCYRRFASSCLRRFVAGRRLGEAEQGDTEVRQRLGASTDQRARLAEDVTLLREHPHVKGRAQVGGFLYDVDTGALTQVL